MSPAGRRPVLDWKAVLGIIFSVGLLYFALRGVDFGAVLREIRTADPFLFLLAVAAATAPFPLRALRWRPLLRPILPDTRFRARYAATCIGFMANNLLPARIGEFARAYALARMERVSITASFGSLVVERLFDGLTVVGLMFLALALPNFPDVGARIGAAAQGVMVFMGALTVVLLVLVLWPVGSVALFEATAARLLPRAVRRLVVDALEAFLQGLGVLRQPALLVQVALWSLVIWLVNAAGFWLAFRAFGIDVPFSGALFLQSLIGIAVALPSAPGFFGLFEAGARVGLVDVWGIELNKALGFALGFHMGGFIPITLIGLYYLSRVGLSFREMGHSEEVVEEAVEEEAPPHTSGGGRAGP